MTGMLRSVAGWGLVVTAAFLAGCSSSSGPQVIKFDNDENIRAVYAAYKSATDKLGRPPKNVEEIKPFLQEHGNPEQLLVSPNDSQPYVIKWGAPPTAAVVVHEKNGQSGKRIVIGGQGILQPPEPVFNAMTGGKGRPPVTRTPEGE